MRKAFLLLVILGLSGTLWAADPIIGTWKLNLAESKNLSRLPVTVEMAIYQEVDEDIELSIIGKMADDSPLSYQIVFPRQGGQVRYKQAVEEGRSEVQTLIAPGDWVVTWMDKGKQVLLRHLIVSKDGKTMRQTLNGLDGEGKTFEAQLVYNKQ